MRRNVFLLLALCFVLLGCDKGDDVEIESRHSEFCKISRMLYEVTYTDYGSEFPNDSYDDISGDMACSCVRNGDFQGRNFDYYMNQCPTIVVRTTAKEGRYATVGVARLAHTSEASVESGLSQDRIDLLPWALFDGMNEKGLVVSSNVVSRNDWGETPHTGTNRDAPELNVICVIRPLLDNCATVKEALDYLRRYNITPMESEYMNLHFMISDPDESYVVEFINNRIVARPQYIMTNYYLFLDSITDSAVGVERYDILKENYGMGGESMRGMWNLMRMVRYSNQYDFPKYKWYSEYSLYFPYSTIGDEDVRGMLDAMLAEQAEEWPEELEYVGAHGFREDSDWWDTVHNSIYDIRNGKLWVTVHEWYDCVYEFSISGGKTVRVPAESAD